MQLQGKSGGKEMLLVLFVDLHLKHSYVTDKPRPWGLEHFAYSCLRTISQKVFNQVNTPSRAQVTGPQNTRQLQRADCSFQIAARLCKKLTKRQSS